MPMQLDDYRLLGRSGLRVSPLSLGTMTFGMPAGWGSDNADAARMVDSFVERGGNFIDTANFYGQGGSEKVLATLLQGRRNRLVVSTKYSLTMGPGDPNASGNQRKNMVQAVEASLRRLETDYIDLLYMHVWDRRTPAEEVLRAFDDLVRAGKVLYVGISDTPAWQIARLQAIADLRGWSPLVALQIPYSLAERSVEREFMPMAQEMGLGVCPWSPLAGGVLSGKYANTELKSLESRQIGDLDTREKINIATGLLNERTLDIAATVGQVAQELGRSSAQVALAWTLRHPAVISPIIGARTYEQFEDNLGALEVEFSDEQVQRLETASAIERCFPQDMIEGDVSDGMFGGVRVALPRQ